MSSRSFSAAGGLQHPSGPERVLPRENSGGGRAALCRSVTTSSRYDKMIDHAREAMSLTVDFPQLISKLEAFFTETTTLRASIGARSGPGLCSWSRAAPDPRRVRHGSLRQDLRLRHPLERPRCLGRRWPRLPGSPTPSPHQKRVTPLPAGDSRGGRLPP